MIMKKILILFIATLMLMVAKSQSITENIATQVCNNKIYEEQGHEANRFQIKSVEEIKSDNETVLYLFRLSPQGFVLIAGEQFAYPILGYSFTSNFGNNTETYPEQLFVKIYTSEITNARKAISAGKYKPKRSNETYKQWEYYATGCDEFKKVFARSKKRSNRVVIDIPKWPRQLQLADKRKQLSG